MKFKGIFIILVLKLLIFSKTTAEVTFEADQHGYVVYCGCMGRFGNQADHFLGALAFSHALNRTLILPPWVEYRKGELKSVQVPFDEYFRVDALLKFTKVITMENFMQQLAPKVWPVEKRISFCYMERMKLDGTSSRSCNAKEGNPFFSFWETFHVDFIDSEFFGPSLNYDVVHRGMDVLWNEKYKADKWPVLAFTGAPASFPVQSENIHLQKYLRWSPAITKKANDFVQRFLPKGAYIAIHLRNGIDWVRACEHIKDVKNLFASAQCLGYNNEKGDLTMDICMPLQEMVLRKIKRVIKRVKEAQKDNQIKSIYVASDNNHHVEYLNEQLRRMKVRAFKLPENNPHVDLAIMGRANYFIGNCVSSFSAFVKRERDARGFPSEFFGFPVEKAHSKLARHTEL